MNIEQLLSQATKALAQAGINSARLDVLILLEDVTGKDRSYLLAHPEVELPTSQIDVLNKFITQRLEHLPLAYIRGRVAFYGRDFTVSNQVLVPRPETESIIELLKAIAFSKPPVIADVGTGSGCIGITAVLELPGSTVHLYDADQSALNVAQANTERHNVRGDYFFSNVLDPWQSDYDIVLANLPYVPNDYPINQAASFEPKLALFSGNDGLDHYRLLWQQVAAHTPRPQHVIIEALPKQHEALCRLAADANYMLHATQGYVQHFKAM